VVEDEEKLATTIALGLRHEGMAVDIAFDGRTVVRHEHAAAYRTSPKPDKTDKTSPKSPERCQKL
jgi:DNA-binding response OmpR family regulator